MIRFKIPLTTLLVCRYRLSRYGGRLSRVLENGREIHELIEKFLGVVRGSGVERVVEPEICALISSYEDGNTFYEICGKPDLVFYNNDEATIVELKYSEHDRQTYGTELLQLLSYALMLKKGGVKNVRTKIIRIVGKSDYCVKSIEVPVDEDRLREIEQELKARLKFIEREIELLSLSPNEVAIPGPYCVNCDLREKDCPIKPVADFVVEYFTKTGYIPPFKHLIKVLEHHARKHKI